MILLIVFHLIKRSERSISESVMVDQYIPNSDIVFGQSGLLVMVLHIKSLTDQIFGSIIPDILAFPGLVGKQVSYNNAQVAQSPITNRMLHYETAESASLPALRVSLADMARLMGSSKFSSFLTTFFGFLDLFKSNVEEAGVCEVLRRK